MTGLLPKFFWHIAASLLAISAGIDTGGPLSYLVDRAISFFAVAAIAYLISLTVAFEECRLQYPRTVFVWFASSAMPELAIGATAPMVAIPASSLNQLLAKCAPAVCTFNLFARRKFPSFMHLTVRRARS